MKYWIDNYKQTQEQIKHIDNLCEEIQQHSEHSNPKNVRKTIKTLTEKILAGTYA